MAGKEKELEEREVPVVEMEEEEGAVAEGGQEALGDIRRGEFDSHPDLAKFSGIKSGDGLVVVKRDFPDKEHEDDVQFTFYRFCECRKQVTQLGARVVSFGEGTDEEEEKNRFWGATKRMVANERLAGGLLFEFGFPIDESA